MATGPDHLQVLAFVGAALASCVIPQQNQTIPPAPAAAGSPAASAAPGHAAAAPTYGPCEYACGQMSRCQLAPYETCVAECRRTGAEQQPGGAEQLEAASRMSCEELAAAVGAQPSYAAEDPPAASEPPEVSPPPASSGGGGAIQGGRWVSADWASYTNPAMTSANFYLEITIGSDGAFRGSWARYPCVVQTYGIWSCGKGPLEGSATGHLDANGTGSIQLERLGRSALAWSFKASGELALELPRDWQGDRVLFQSTLKR